MLAHRARGKRKYRSFPPSTHDADFIVLTLVALIYAAIILIFFRDYTFIVVRDLVRYYVAANWHVRQTMMIMAPLPCQYLRHGPDVFRPARIRPRGPEKRSSYRCRWRWSSCASSHCLIQMKGFAYHFVPAIGFLGLALSPCFSRRPPASCEAVARRCSAWNRRGARVRLCADNFSAALSRQRYLYGRYAVPALCP